MRWPWQVRVYIRTCTDCGYTWQVPRSAARRRRRSVSVLAGTAAAGKGSVVRAEFAREVDSISAEGEPAEVFRHCPKCGSDDFTQRALPRKQP